MAIKSNVDTTKPSRDRFKQEVVLLSHGYACRTAFPDGKITVYPWDSTIDEWVARSARQNISSRMFTLELFKKLCDLNGCPFESFVVGDVSTVILIARSIRHNSRITYTPVCPFCKAKNKEEAVAVPDELARIGEKTADYVGYDMITLPVDKDIVKIRPLIISDEVMLDGRSDSSKSAVSDELAHVLATVVDVGGGQPTSLEELLAWFNALHPEDQSYFSKSVDHLSPHLSPEIEHECDSCGRPFTQTLPFEDKNFFRSVKPSLQKG